MKLYCFFAALMPSGIAMRISKMKLTRPSAKLYQTVSWNFWVTGTVHAQLSPHSPLTALFSHVK